MAPSTQSSGYCNDTLHDSGLPTRDENFHHRNQKQRQQRARTPLAGVLSDKNRTAECMLRLIACKFDSNNVETTLRHLFENALGHDSTASDSPLAEPRLDCARVCHSCSSLGSLKWHKEQHQQHQQQQQQQQLEYCSQLQSHADYHLERSEAPLASSTSSPSDCTASLLTRQSTLASAKSGTKTKTASTAAKVRLQRSSPIGSVGNWQTFAFALFVSLIIFSSSQPNRSNQVLTSAKSIESSPASDKPAKLPRENQLSQASEPVTSSNTGPDSIRPTPTETPTTRSPNASIRKLDSIFASNSSTARPEQATEASIEPVTATTSAPGSVSSLATATTSGIEIKAQASSTESESAAASETVSESAKDESTSAGDDDNDAEDCQGVSGGDSQEGPRLTDNERLVNLQACLQKKVKAKLSGLSRSGMALFDELSLSGGCASSLMTLMYGVGELKSYAFKFLDASAKIPSGVMYGLLSDFGDFDECLSIRSNPLVQPADEADEGTFSGKYCLLSIKLNYRVQLAPNSSVPDGIYPDGVLWDELIRNYWTSKSTKGFQMGVCIPSRCNSDDISQLYQLSAKSYNFRGEVTSCQDSNDLRRQQTPDTVQLLILRTFGALIVLSVVATLVDRNRNIFTARASGPLQQYSQSIEFVVQLVTCFSIRRNWRLFLDKQDANTGPAPGALRVTTGGQTEPLAVPSCRPTQLRNCINSFQSNLTQFTDTSGSVEECSHHPGVSDSPDGDTSKRSVSASELGGQSHQCSSSQSQPPPSRMSVNSSSQESNKLLSDYYCQLNVDIAPQEAVATSGETAPSGRCQLDAANRQQLGASDQGDLLSHLSGLKLFVIVWITLGHSFLYPSANNYQHYRSIINMNITRDSVWFAVTNFTLGIDMLLYMIGLRFVHKLANNNVSTFSGHSCRKQTSPVGASNQPKTCADTDRASSIGPTSLDIVWLILRKILRLWPTYLAVISLAIVVPLLSDGPMWPEMVSRRLGDACRSSWWTNLLMANNFAAATDICLPSSWFLSIIMQCFLVGSVIALLARKRSLNVAISMLVLLLLGSILISFAYAYQLGVRAPAIRMDESFVLEIDDSIYRLYTNIFNNLGPFLVGMLGGIVLIKWTIKNDKRQWQQQQMKRSNCNGDSVASKIDKLTKIVCNFNVLFAISLLAILVLSSVFHQHYTQFWASIYWSCHRTGWAIVTGYLVHQCATGRWKLLRDLLSLSSFIPLSKLIFIAYLVYPIFIHIHSGLVRDGLHVTVYNMMNIYITRIVMTFVTALAVYLLIELPFCSIEEILLKKWLLSRRQTTASQGTNCTDKMAMAHPLLVVAPTVCLNQCPAKLVIQRTESNSDEAQLGSKPAAQLGTACQNDTSLAQSLPAVEEKEAKMGQKTAQVMTQ